jgi:hypothetical protein
MNIFCIKKTRRKYEETVSRSTFLFPFPVSPPKKILYIKLLSGLMIVVAESWIVKQKEAKK